MPTMLELAGAEVPRGHRLDGVSLVPILLEGKTLAARKLFWQYNEKQAMRDGEWKLVVGEKGLDGLGLFDLDSDLGEEEDLSAAEPERVKRMVAELAAWYEEVLMGATEQPEKE